MDHTQATILLIEVGIIALLLALGYLPEAVVPCGALARGMRASPPQFPSPPGYFTPVSQPMHAPPFNDWIDNNPCGKKIVTSVAGVDVSAEALCPLHWQMKNGQAAYKAPIVLEP